MWAAAIPYIVQGITSLFQMNDGEDKARTERPDYQIPEEQKIATAIAKANYADQTMPGESRMYDQNNLAATNALKAITEGGGSLSNISSIQAQQSKNAGDIATQAQEYQRKDEMIYQDMLKQMAEYKDQQWQINKFAPYAQAYQEGRQEVGAGLENLYGSLNGIANIVMSNQYINGNNQAVLANQANNSALQTSTINQTYERMSSPGNNFQMSFANDFQNPTPDYNFLTQQQMSAIMGAMR